MNMLFENKIGAFGLLVTDKMGQAFGGSSPTASAFLFALDQNGPMNASELASVAGVTQPTAVRVTNGLISKGYVRRGRKSGKTVPLGLTPAGRRFAKKLQKERLATLGKLFEGISGPEQNQLERVLDKVLAAATTSRGFARTACRFCDHEICDGSNCPIGSRANKIEGGLT